MKGDEHILSVMESKEQQKKSLVKNEHEIKQERQARELHQQELELNGRISDLNQVLDQFGDIFRRKANWEDPTSNAALNKLIMDSNVIKNLRKEIMTNQNRKLESERRIENLRGQIEKLRLKKRQIGDKIERKKRKFKSTRSSELIQSECACNRRKVLPEKGASGRDETVVVEYLQKLQIGVRFLAE